MDDHTLESLQSALEKSPENTQLLAVVLRALLERQELERAGALLDQTERGLLTGDDERAVAAEVLFKTGRPKEALELCDGESGEALLLRARILAELGRRDEALDAYQQATTKNPTLEDLDLKARLGARIREVGGDAGRPRLKVISNDDTDETELSRVLVPAGGKVTFADVGGLDDVKKQVERRIILPYKKPSIFRRFKKRVGGGILLYGPPGCGKTLLARATAGECEATFFNVAISDILDMYIGESERKLHAVFEKARSSAPAVLFFDELEALAGKRQYSREGTSSKLVSLFLSEMDGFSQNNAGVLILGATNVPWAVDAAFRRAGRFDRVLFVPPPDREARADILKKMFADRPVAKDVRVGELAKRTRGFSGADLDNLVETAGDEAIEQSLADGSEVPIGRRHLMEALEQVKPTTMEWLTTARNYARYANEAGQYDEVLAFLEKHGKN